MHIENIKPRSWVVVTNRITEVAVTKQIGEMTLELDIETKRIKDPSYCSDGMPLKVKAISPPFILCTGPLGTEMLTVDTSKFQLTTPTSSYVKTFKKMVKEQVQLRRLYKGTMLEDD